MRVLISGYYGFENAGDELILESIVLELKNISSDINVTVLSANPDKTALIYKINSVNRWNFFKVLKAVFEADVLISGGGGLFQDRTGNLSLYYYLLIILLAKITRKRIIILSVGVNNLKSINRFITAKIFRFADRITVRESESLDLLIEWGCSNEKIEVTADMVILREIEKKKLPGKSPRIVFVLRPPSIGNWSVENFASLADSLVQRLGAKITFVPFQLGCDLKFSQLISEVMLSDSEIFQWENPASLCELFSGQDLVISQRLHGLILAAICKIPFMGISEDPKILRFLRELGQKNIHKIPETGHYPILPVIMDIWEWREEFSNNASRLLPSFKIRAKRNIEILRKEMRE